MAGASLRSSALLASRVLLFAASYYLAARLGLGFRFQSSSIGVVWPANALLVSALLLTPKRRWWVVLVSGATAHIAVMGPLVPAWLWSWQCVGNGLFATATAATLRRFAGLPLHFGSRRQAFVYTVVSFVMPLLLAFMAASFLRSLLGFDPTFTPPAALLRLVLSNTTAMLLLAPLVLLWAPFDFRRLNELPNRRLLEAAAVMVSLLTVGLIAFGTGAEVARLPWVLLWIFPPLLWAAVRMGPRGAATSLFCIAVLSLWGTAHQLGPFVIVHDADQVMSLQLFWVVLCPPIMLLAAVIREREQLEEALNDQRNQLAHVTRVATAGEMSGALAHELRQPLTAILANAQAGIQLLELDPVDLHEVREILQDISRQDQHAASVIARLRSFLKEGESRFEPLAIETVVRDALALSNSAVELSGVEVQTQIAAGLPRVRGDPVQLLQVMVNLVVNGCEAMSRIPPPERRLRLVAAPFGREHVEVMVADSGVGLPAGGEDRVFEAFFTTKDKGLGLGLAIGRSIVTAHGGRLWAENNAHRGATFHLLLHSDNANSSQTAADRDR